MTIMQYSTFFKYFNKIIFLTEIPFPHLIRTKYCPPGILQCLCKIMIFNQLLINKFYENKMSIRYFLNFRLLALKARGIFR